jgi:hypothetical protein
MPDDLRRNVRLVASSWQVDDRVQPSAPQVGRAGDPSLAGVTVDEISQGPRRDFRLPSWRWRAAAAAAGLVAVIAAVLVAGSGGRHIVRVPGVIAAPSPLATAAPGTVLLTCESANWGPLGPNWQAGSVKAGPLWFVNGRQDGYVHYGRSLTAVGALPRHGMVNGVMIIEVAAGSTVAMTAAPSSRSYFQFFGGFYLGVGNPLPAGDTGFTFAPCPASAAGPNGLVTDFNLGFSIVAGRAAPVEVWVPGSRRPIWLTFTAPRTPA